MAASSCPIMDFGKHKGITLDVLLSTKPKYIKWLLKHSDKIKQPPYDKWFRDNDDRIQILFVKPQPATVIAICPPVTQATPSLMSQGEINCARDLTKLGLKFRSEYILKSLPNRRFDFKFQYLKCGVLQNCLIEIDGVQHFTEVKHFHTNKSKYGFAYRQEVDLLKTIAALVSEYYVIRIDYKQIENIGSHITKAIKILGPEQRVYYSDPVLYRYLSDKIPK